MGSFRNLGKQIKNSQPTMMDTLRGFGRVVRSQGLTGVDPFAIRRAAKLVRNERKAYEAANSLGRDGYFSKDEYGRIDVLVDRNGYPTSTYPHVHVVHNDSEGGIRIIASSSKGVQLYETTLPASSDGRTVETAVAKARSFL